MKKQKLIHIILAIFILATLSYAQTPELKIHFLDVGQADSILIQARNGQNTLIDAGNREDAATIKSYLTAQKVRKIDNLVATHPHEDHIGGMAQIVKSFPIGQVYMPRVSTNTRTFEDLLRAIKSKGLKVKTARAGLSLSSTPLTMEMLAPTRDQYQNLNDYSAVIKITYGKTSFLLTGDAAASSELEMESNNPSALKADLLKVGHHGSNTSTTAPFLKAVAPKYAIISVGTGNDYGHPGQYLLKRLTNAGVQILRTDQCGTIIATSDGQKITLDKKASPIKPNAPAGSLRLPVEDQNNEKGLTVYITKSGRKYHVAGCNSLSHSCIPITLKEAQQRGYGPCKRCNPPQ